MMDSGLVGKRPVMVFGGVCKEIVILDSGLKIRLKDTVFILGLMVTDTKESG